MTWSGSRIKYSPNMDRQFQTGRPKLARAVALLALLCGLEARAGEKIQFSGRSKNAELPKANPAEELDTSRLNVPRNNDSAPIEIPRSQPNVPQLSPAQTLKLREELDRKKNWAFADPKAESKEESLAKSFGVRENRLEIGEKKFKGVVERSLEPKDPKSRLDNRRGARDDEENFSLVGSRDKSDSDNYRTREKAKETGVISELNLKNYLNPSIGDQSDALKVPDALSRNRFNNSRVGEDSNQTPAKKLEKERAEEARIAEFQKLLQPRSLSAGLGVVDPISREINGTRQEMNPITPRRFESPREVGGYKSLIPAPGSGLAGGGVVEAQNGRAAAPTSLAPSFTPPPPVVRMEPRPMILEVPRRKF